MATIRNQSIVGTIFLYIGVLLGFTITGILFPKILSTDQIGLLRLLVSYSAIFSQIASLGWPTVTNRMFPYFRNKENIHNGYFFLLIAIAIIGFIVSIIIFFILKPWLVSINIEKSSLLLEYINYLIPFIFATLVFSFLDTYTRVLFHSVEGTFAREVFQRIVTLASIILFFYKIIDFKTFVIMYLIARFSSIAVLLVFLIRKKEISFKPQLKFLDKALIKTIVSVGLYGIIGSIVYNTILNIDSIIVGSMLGIGSTGIYATSFFFGTLIIIPTKALRRISSIFLATAWKNNDLKQIRDIYYKSSVNQFLISLILLILLMVNLDNIFKFLPQEFAEGRYVILFVGLAMLIESFSGNSGVIISLSKHYKIGTVFSLINLSLIIVTNFIFIPIWGIAGAAFATFSTMTFSMIIRYIFLRSKYQLKIYDYKHILIVIIGLAAFFINKLIPVNDNLYIDVVIRSAVVTSIYATLVYVLKVSFDVNEVVNLFISKLRKK
jgi:O-antigen/teichoic acid export membrane protein